MPVLEETSPPDSEMSESVHVYGYTNIADILVENGIVQPWSPAGCQIEYTVGAFEADTVDTQSEYYINIWPESYTRAMLTGLIFRVDADTCTDQGTIGTPLSVAVPVHLEPGKYVIIPILGREDRGLRLPVHGRGALPLSGCSSWCTRRWTTGPSGHGCSYTIWVHTTRSLSRAARGTRA